MGNISPIHWFFVALIQ